MSAVYDRIAGRTASRLPALVLPGQWWMDGPPDVHGDASGSYVVPDTRGRCVGHEDSQGVDTSCMVDLLPPPIIQEGLRDIAETLSIIDTWKDFLDVPPLSAARKRGAIQPLDQLIGRRLGVLEEICRAPRSQLDLFDERVAVSRARRLPPSAPQYLAVHVEDWEFPTIVGVHPKRLLSSVAEDRLNIYENQVVARLIDGLLDYLRRRISEVERLLISYQETEQYANQAEQGTFWKRGRVYELWGEQLDAAAEILRAKAVLRRLRPLRRRLSALVDSPLYKSIPRQAGVPGTLKQTNIFVNDTLYRYIAQLWRQWSRLEAKAKPSSQELVQSRQQLCCDFGQYCRLLVLRALSELGLQPNASPTPAPSSSNLSGANGKVVVHSQADGTLTLEMEGAYKRMRIVPIAATVNELPKDRLQSALDVAFVGLTMAGQAESVLVLYLGTNPRATLPLNLQRALACPHVPARSTMPPIMPVSPLSIESMERVARVLRWWISGQQYLQCPRRIDRPTALDPQAVPPGDWLRVEDKSFWMVRPPSEAEMRRFHGWLTGARRPARMATARADEEAMRRFERTTAEAVAIITPLTYCPTCREHVDAAKCLHYQSPQFWRLRCSECKTQWGVQRCPHSDCGRTYPVIIVPASGARTSASPLWVNSALGRDVLAEPCCAGGGAFTCPFCGRCPDADAAGVCPACSQASDSIAGNDAIQS